MLLGFLLIGNRVVACHEMCGSEHQHEEKAEKKTTGTKMEMKESFYSTVYTCPMHSEIQQEKPGKCPKCGMELEKKEILMTYACPEKDCEIQKVNPGKCPHHDKELIKCEVKSHCPKCGSQVDKSQLIKPKKEEIKLRSAKKMKKLVKKFLSCDEKRVYCVKENKSCRL
jgi:predicted RNA-binding Zn-ribbon protein involved in translation (DUF1610 family)